MTRKFFPRLLRLFAAAFVMLLPAAAHGQWGYALADRPSQLAYIPDPAFSFNPAGH